METKVIHIKHKTGAPEEVYIGRGSMFGNPYKLMPGARKGSTLPWFKAYFYDRLETDAKFKAAVHALKGKTLVCFCKPFPCHGDVIQQYLEDV